jgi:hypothetical protein
MSKKRNKRNTKKVLKSLQAKRAAYHSGGHNYAGRMGWQPHNPRLSSHNQPTGGGSTPTTAKAKIGKPPTPKLKRPSGSPSSFVRMFDAKRS